MENEVLKELTQGQMILGNPPFVGARIMDSKQKKDVLSVFGKIENVGNLDYVCCWYKKSAVFMQGTSIQAALVSTNSISQGEQAASLWKPLFEVNIHIDFAHRTFRWDSEAKIKAHVHCVVIGFSAAAYNKPKILFTSDRPQIVQNINGYLLDADNIFVEGRNKSICDVPVIGIGNMPIDGRNYLFTEDEKNNFLEKEPRAERVRYFKENKEGVKAMSKAMEEFAKKWAEDEIQERNEEVALELLRLGGDGV